MKKLDKSPRRLAMEIKGKSRLSAENHLTKFGASASGAAAAVAMHIGVRSGTIVGLLRDIEYSIETNC
jgi:hypothetical protein